MDTLIAIAMIALVFISTYEIFIISTQASYTRAKKIEAAQLAQEGIEAVRTLRNNSWTDNIASLTNGTTYYLEFSANEWTLTTSPPNLINALYTRTIILTAVNRDANDNISPTGTLDPDTKKITVTVSWPEKGENKSISLETYITNFFDT